MDHMDHMDHMVLDKALRVGNILFAAGRKILRHNTYQRSTHNTDSETGGTDRSDRLLLGRVGKNLSL